MGTDRHILHGLHRCRDGGSESLLEYSPDFADERAAEVVRQCRALAVDIPVDDFCQCPDGLGFAVRSRMVDAMSEAGWSPVGVDGTHQYATVASVFWPEEEFRILVARWPYVGATWDEHRRRVKRHCALLEQEGLRVQQLPGDVSGFATFLAARKVTEPDDLDLVNTYPDCAPSRSR